MPPNKQDTSVDSGVAAASAEAAAAVAAARGTTAPSAPTGLREMWREDEGKSFKVKEFYPPASTRRTRSDLTMAEVAKHDKRTDAWIVVDGHCYDVTQYVETHPGGWLPISNLAGKDVTDAFANYHPARVYEHMLPRFYIGEVADYEVSDFVREHRALRQQLLKRGLFETNPWYYINKTILLIVGFVVMLYTVLVLEQRAIGAVMLGMFWQQLAFMGHDVGHNSVSHVRKADLFWGTLFGNLTGGISLAWWKRSHNVHHVVCNSVENDPDIQHVPIMAVSRKMFKPFWSTYHEREYRMDFALARFLVGYQHYLFYLAMSLARFNLYVQSWRLLLSKEGGKLELRKLEVVSLSGFAVWLTALCFSFPSWLDVLQFLLISHATTGLLHIQICLSHFYMDFYHGRAYNDDSDEWFTMQLKTTMNVACPAWLDWFHGGLQFQIEHHLWPRLPRHNLREARKLVKPFCEKHGIRYHEPGFVEGNLNMLRHMRNVALASRDNDTFTANDLYDTPIWNGLNARG
jgi:fatty acid desaturase